MDKWGTPAPASLGTALSPDQYSKSCRDLSWLCHASYEWASFHQIWLSSSVLSMARLKRCRTGCLICRVRRRKCRSHTTTLALSDRQLISAIGDERTPQCRNCTDKDVECRYGSRLTFLDKNVLTLQSQITRPLPTSGYSAIRVGIVNFWIWLMLMRIVCQ